MFQSIKFVVVVFVCLGVLSGSAQAKEFFVDQKHPSADDKNPGAQDQPFKTIQPAVDKAQPGDTIYVKAGVYSEPVKVAHNGFSDAPITIAAWKDDRVEVGSPPKALPAGGQWQGVAGSKSFQVKLNQDVPDDFVLVLNDRPVPTLKQDDRTFGGVPFKIATEGNCAVVLKSVNRPNGNLPASVTIPIGRKFDTLFFLHSAAWVGGNEFFRYVVHYADGKDQVISVGPQNLTDWIADPVARFPTEEGTFTTAAQTVRVPRFRQGTVYRMEWSAPRDRRAVEIKSIEFVGNGSSVPVLLGITGVLEW